MRYFVCLIVLSCFSVTLLAQNTELQLARQYAKNGEQQKALDILQKLYKEDNDSYYTDYVSTLLAFKKIDDAVSITKKMIRKHPTDPQYVIQLGIAYTQQGTIDKANLLYDELIKNLQPNQNDISLLATQFYRNTNIDYAIKVFLPTNLLICTGTNETEKGLLMNTLPFYHQTLPLLVRPKIICRLYLKTIPDMIL